jgi:hypothetical protein
MAESRLGIEFQGVITVAPHRRAHRHGAERKNDMRERRAKK